MERRVQRRFSKFDDPTIVYIDGRGMPIPASHLARLFNQSPEEKQASLAYRCVNKYNISPDYVLSWITADSARVKFELWCHGKNIPLKKDVVEKDGPTKVPRYLAADEDLIDELSPHLKQIDLARILAIRRYKELDEEVQQYLVYGVYRLIGSYLGPRRYYRRESQTPTLLPLPSLPAEIFEDDLISNILYESERETSVPIFNKSVEEGFRYLAELGAAATHPLQRAFIERLADYSKEVVGLSVPEFNTTIAGSQKDLPAAERTVVSVYPSYHQKEYAYRFIHKPIKADLCIGDTGTMKTGAFIYAMGAVGAKSPLVICPPGLIKDNWEREIKEKYAIDVEVFKMNSEKDLREVAESPSSGKLRYTILPYSILSRLSPTLETSELIARLVNNCSIDSLGVDEVHLAKEYSATCTQILYMISRALPKDAPRIAMTATGVVNRVEDLDAPVRILRPYDYPNPGDFTRAARNDPTLVSALLHGQGLLTRWTAEGILGDELPPVEYHDEPVPLSHFHQALYDYIHSDNTIEAQVKRGMLRQVSLDPLLIRRHYHPSRVQEMIRDLKTKLELKQSDRDRQILEERIKALEERLAAVTNLCSPKEALKQLEEAYNKYIQWKSRENPNEKFNEDFLIRLGYEGLVLWSFFNLSGGLDALVKESEMVTIKADWEQRDGLYSSKYQYLEKKLAKLLADGKTKVIIGSGFYQHEVTTGIEDLSEDDELAFLSLYDHLRSWFGDKTVLKIDGSVSLEPKGGELAERERIRRAWRLDPNKKVLLQTIRASRLGIDLSIPPIEVNRDIERVVIIFLDDPDTHADKIQFVGRGRRKGCKKIPVEVITLKTTNLEHPSTLRYGFIDHGIAEALEFKQLLSQMVLDGIPLTEEEERKVRAHLSHLRINLYPETPRAYLYTKVFPTVRGRGFKVNREFFRQVGFEGLSNADFFASYYSKSDNLALPGHNSRVVAEVIRRYQEVIGRERYQIGSIGAGAGILQLTLGQRIVNVDMLEEILEVARKRNSSEGHFIVADAARLPIKSDIFDITDASLVLHWTNNNPNIRRDGVYLSERAIALLELNRITKLGGLVTITLPHAYLTGEQFTNWVAALEQDFGFRLRPEIPSGLVRAIDFRNEPISWMFNLEKASEPSPRLDHSGIALDFERVVDIISESGAAGGREQSITVNPLLPHQEFEIVKPHTGEVERITYIVPSVDEDLDRVLGGIIRPFSSGIEVAVELGQQEYGLYRRLTREAKRTLSLSNVDAEKVALKVINIWCETGNQRHDINRIWSELKMILNEVQKGDK